jgi:hypothetical protein
LVPWQAVVHVGPDVVVVMEAEDVQELEFSFGHHFFVLNRVARLVYEKFAQNVS